MSSAGERGAAAGKERERGVRHHGADAGHAHPPRRAHPAARGLPLQPLQRRRPPQLVLPLFLLADAAPAGDARQGAHRLRPRGRPVPSLQGARAQFPQGEGITSLFMMAVHGWMLVSKTKMFYIGGVHSVTMFCFLSEVLDTNWAAQ